VSQPEEINLEKMTPEDIKRLLEKAKDTEWRYLLKIEEWARQGSAYDDVAEFEVVYGEADLVRLEDYDAGYPGVAGTEYLVVPKTVPVIILWRHYQDYGNGSKSTRIVFIFTKDGWKYVEAY